MDHDSSLVKLCKVVVSDIGVTFCGGKIEIFLQTFIAPVLPRVSSCDVRSYSDKAMELQDTGIFIRIPTVAGKFQFISLLPEYSPPFTQKYFNHS